MDRKNNGGRTTGFGFAKQKPISEVEEVKAESHAEVKAEVKSEESKVIYLDDKMKDAKRIEQKEDVTDAEAIKDIFGDISPETLLALCNDYANILGEEDEEEEDDDEGLDQ